MSTLMEKLMRAHDEMLAERQRRAKPTADGLIRELRSLAELRDILDTEIAECTRQKHLLLQREADIVFRDSISPHLAHDDQVRVAKEIRRLNEHRAGLAE